MPDYVKVLQARANTSGFLALNGNNPIDSVGMQLLSDSGIETPLLVSLTGQFHGFPASRRSLIGHNTDIDSGSTPEDIWEPGGLYPFQTSAQPLEILSTDTNDTAAGTGARMVTVLGLDSDWFEISETVTMNGTTPVALTLQYLRINAVTVATAGSASQNIGDITLRVAGGGDIQGFIGATDGNAHQAILSVPANRVAFFIRREAAILRTTAAGSVELHVYVRNTTAQGAWLSRNLISLSTSGSSAYVKDLPFAPVPAKSDFRVTCTFSSGSNSQVAATLDYLLLNQEAF